MKIEILFPEFCNLFGDMSNMRYLQKCLPQGEFVETPFESVPLFVTETPSLVYLGPMTERTQERVIEKFRPYRDRLSQLIDGGVCFLFTGNALEIMGDYIEKEDGGRIQGLGLFRLYAKQDMMHRHNSTFLGKFREEELMGFKSQFTMAYTDPDYLPFCEVTRGVGLNQGLKTEGIRCKNFIGTYLLGPVLILNPPLTRYLISLMGEEHPTLAFEAEMESAYQERLRDFHQKT